MQNAAVMGLENDPNKHDGQQSDSEDDRISARFGNAVGFGLDGGVASKRITRIALLGDTIEKEAPMSILVLLIVLILVFGVGGGVYNKGAYRNYGYGGGGLLLIILIILLVSGYVHV